MEGAGRGSEEREVGGTVQRGHRLSDGWETSTGQARVYYFFCKLTELFTPTVHRLPARSSRSGNFFCMPPFFFQYI
jgi:hypothetical protein